MGGKNDLWYGKKAAKRGKKMYDFWYGCACRGKREGEKGSLRRWEKSDLWYGGRSGKTTSGTGAKTTFGTGENGGRVGKATFSTGCKYDFRYGKGGKSDLWYGFANTTSGTGFSGKNDL